MVSRAASPVCVRVSTLCQSCRHRHRRLNASHKAAEGYIAQFPNPVLRWDLQKNTVGGVCKEDLCMDMTQVAVPFLP